SVSVLTRKKSDKIPFPQYVWNPAKNEIDPQAVQGIDVVINLSGAGIMEKRWTAAYKKEILDSRTESGKLLMSEIKKHPEVKHFISSSGVSFYGMDTGAEPMEETNPSGDGFLPEVTAAWEKSTEDCPKTCLRTLLR